VTIRPATDESLCPACGAGGLRDFFRASGVPVHVGVLHDSPDEARRAPKGDVVLSWCPRCAFVHNRTFDLAKLSFRPGYEASLIHSETFRTFLEGVASRLVERFDLHEKTVLEIGCGTGFFLERLCRLGGNDGVGIDPTLATDGEYEVEGRKIRLIRDYFSGRHEQLDADFVCCLSVFEVVPEPVQFLESVRRMIGDRPAGVYFEVLNGFRAIRRFETWSIHYEQCNYFERSSLAGLFERCGFEVLEAAPCYEGEQYLHVEARAGCSATSAGSSSPSVLDEFTMETPEEIRRFSEQHARGVERWRRRLSEFESRGSRSVVWGSGGKGISFLHALDTGGLIPYVVDINPRRQGKYVPGSAQRIVPPEFLVEYAPDQVIVTNPLYESEIRRQLDKLGVRCELFRI